VTLSPEPVRAFIVDIDDTIALKSGRRNWDDWALVGTDTPNLPVVAIVSALIRAGHNVMFVTGRPEQCRDETARWLQRHMPLSIGSPLLMREDGDYQPSDTFKEGILDQLLAGGVEVIAAFDDHVKVASMYRRRGVACLQVGDNDY
jgi:hypothetical protein